MANLALLCLIMATLIPAAYSRVDGAICTTTQKRFADNARADANAVLQQVYEYKMTGMGSGHLDCENNSTFRLRYFGHVNQEQSEFIRGKLCSPTANVREPMLIVARHH